MRTVKDIVIYSNGKRRRIRALFDTGATVNYLDSDIAAEFPGATALPEPWKVGLGGRKITLRELVPLSVQIGSRKMPSVTFYPAQLKKFDAIVGAFFMEQWGVVLDPARKQLRIKRDRFELQEEF